MLNRDPVRPVEPRRPSATAVRVAIPLAVLGLAVAAGTAVADARSAAQSAVAAATVNSVPASADTYVVTERPDLSYGTQNKITAARWTTPWHSEAYLRFAVPAPPPGQPIIRVRLEVTFDRLDAQPTSIELRSLTGTWSETTTYATRPAVGGVLGTFTFPAQGTTSAAFDVTAAVTGAGQYSFAITNPTAQSVASMFSREHGADGPRLIIEYGQRTLCGASFTTELPDETYQQALARVDGYYNGLDTVRVFYPGLPQAWPGKLNAGTRPLIVSFKAPPAEVIAGTHDTALRGWFQNAPRDRDTYWTYFHEPENDIMEGRFTAAQFRQAWQRIAGLARAAGNTRLQATLILMGWSVNPASGRNWRDYYPGRQHVDVIGWDLYNPSWSNGAYKNVTDMFADVIAASRSEALPFGIAETGSPRIAGDSGTGRAAWLRELTRHLSDSGAVFIAYFDLDWPRAGVDYRLRDSASMAAWREFCT